MDLSSFVVLVLLATVGLRFALVAAIVWLLVPRRRHCPKCATITLPLVSPRLMRIVRLERRWCLDCSWQGLSKRLATSGTIESSPVETVRSGDHNDGHSTARWDDDDQWSPVRDEGWR